METGGFAARLVAAARPLWLDRRAAIAAILLAVVTTVLVAFGLGVPVNGGLLRYAPYATLILAPITVVLLVIRPWYGLCLWMLFMPFMNVAQVQVFVGPEQLILTTVFLVGLLTGAVLEHRRNAAALSVTEAEMSTRIAWVLLAVAALLTVISTALTPSLARSVPIAQHGLLEPLLLIGLVLWLRPSWPQLAVLLASMGASVAIGSVLSLTRMLLRFAQTLDQFEAQREQLSRLVYFNVGIFGDMLAMALPLLLAWLLLRRKGPAPRLSGVVIALAITVSLLCAYLTFSKSGWLGAIIGCAGLFALSVSSWRVRIAVAAIALVLVSFVIPYPSLLLRVVSPSAASIYSSVVTTINSRAETIDPGNPEGEVSVTERLIATETGIRMAIDHPLLGVGPGSFAYEYSHDYRVTAATRALDSAHNLLPYVAAEFGLIVAGLVALGLLAGLLGAALTYLRAPPDEVLTRIGAAAVGAALIGFLVVSTTFGVDLYRAYRTMNSDVLFAALLVGAGVMLPRVAREGRTTA